MELMNLNVDNLILQALREDITSEDITTNSVMREYRKGQVELICKQDGIIAGLGVFKRVFERNGWGQCAERTAYRKDYRGYPGAVRGRADCP